MGGGGYDSYLTSRYQIKEDFSFLNETKHKVLSIKFQTHTTLVSFLIPNLYHYMNQTLKSLFGVKVNIQCVIPVPVLVCFFWLRFMACCSLSVLALCNISHSWNHNSIGNLLLQVSIYLFVFVQLLLTFICIYFLCLMIGLCWSCFGVYMDANVFPTERNHVTMEQFVYTLHCIHDMSYRVALGFRSLMLV